MGMARKGDGESATAGSGSVVLILLYWEVPSTWLPHLPPITVTVSVT